MSGFAKRYNHAHLVGIGGVGMAGLARVLHGQGVRVTGSDIASSNALADLATDGFEVYVGHAAVQLGEADLLVYSAAVSEDNVELAAAAERGIDCASRAQVLGAMSRERRTAAIAGTHGKTTSAAMVADILQRADWQPDILVGGEVDGRIRASVGRGEWLVVEADEYARSFLELYPEVALITCVEADHLDCYTGIIEVEQAFVAFLQRMPFYSVALLGGDGLVSQRVVEAAGRRVLTFGQLAGNDYQIVDVVLDAWSSRFGLRYAGDALVDIELGVPGIHNVRNAAGAVALAHQFGVDMACCRAALAQFRSVDRRFQLRGDVGDVRVVDDYAHHPSEVAAALATARASGRRIVAVFQPHLYSRTRDFADAFARALAEADRVVLAAIYPARETPIAGVDATLIERALRGIGYDEVDYVEDGTALVSHVINVCRPGDIVLTMGAGDIGQLAGLLVKMLERVAR